MAVKMPSFAQLYLKVHICSCLICAQVTDSGWFNASVYIKCVSCLICAQVTDSGWFNASVYIKCVSDIP